MSEAESWLAAQPKLSRGKIDVRLLIAEGIRRGYCVCPKPMRQIIDVTGLTCSWCGQPEAKSSWHFWYGSDD
jgi:hypothetical protein